jgi:hypothetical protein
VIGTIETGSHQPQSGDAYAAAANGTYGLSALLTAINTRLATLGYTAPDNANIVNIHNIVNHVDYGNAKLVRATTPANSIDVSATGEVSVGAVVISGGGDATLDNQEAMAATLLAIQNQTDQMRFTNDYIHSQVKAQDDIDFGATQKASIASAVPTASGIASAVWSSVTRTLTSIADSAGITTLLNRIIGTLATGTHQPQSGDSYPVVSNVTYGLSALKTILDSIGAAVGSYSSVTATNKNIRICQVLYDEEYYNVVVAISSFDELDDVLNSWALQKFGIVSGGQTVLSPPLGLPESLIYSKTITDVISTLDLDDLVYEIEV